MNRTFRVYRTMGLTAVLMLAVLLPIIPAYGEAPSRGAAMLGWGLESGRADETDVEALIANQMSLKRTMKIIENFVREGLSVERNFELLGIKIEGKPNIKQVMIAADKWWKTNVLGVIKQIATNHAS